MIIVSTISETTNATLRLEEPTGTREVRLESGASYVQCYSNENSLMPL